MYYLRATSPMLPLVAFCVFSAGCGGGRFLFEDHKLARKNMIDLQDHQIIDNLIRVKQGKPPIHINYASINGKVSSTASITGRISDDDNDMLSAAMSTVVELDEDETGAEANLSLSDEFSSAGKMVTGPAGAQLLETYRAFAKIVQEQPENPGKGDYLFLRRSNGKYYFLEMITHVTDANGNVVSQTDNSEKYLDFCRAVIFDQLSRETDQSVVVTKAVINAENIIELKVRPQIVAEARGTISLNDTPGASVVHIISVLNNNDEDHSVVLAAARPTEHDPAQNVADNSRVWVAAIKCPRFLHLSRIDRAKASATQKPILVKTVD